MIADIVYTIFKCLNFIIFERNLKKNIPPTRYGVQKSKKVEKCVFFAAGLSKVISMRNKKMSNVISCILLINFISKNYPPTQNLTKTAKICLKRALERRRVKQIKLKLIENCLSLILKVFSRHLLNPPTF